MTDFISDIRKRHEHDQLITDSLYFPEHHWQRPRVGQKAHDDRAALLAEVEKLRAERDEARAEVERLRAERDTLVRDARGFVRWFNRHYTDPSRDPGHPWCAINFRLNAHADVLETFDSGVETKEAKP